MNTGQLKRVISEIKDPKNCEIHMVYGGVGVAPAGYLRSARFETLYYLEATKFTANIGMVLGFALDLDTDKNLSAYSMDTLLSSLHSSTDVAKVYLAGQHSHLEIVEAEIRTTLDVKTSKTKSVLIFYVDEPQETE